MLPSKEEGHRNIEAEIEELEGRLKELRASRHPSEAAPVSPLSQPPIENSEVLHTLLLLSDSALPLGSFAFSNGLESYLAHRRLNLPGSHPKSASNSSPSSNDPFPHFLHLSLTSVASTSLPFLLTAHTHPSLLSSLDNDLDAQTPCPVGRRASVAQGRALLTVWERSLASSSTHSTMSSRKDPAALEAINALSAFASDLRNWNSGKDSSSSSTGSSSSCGPCSTPLATVAAGPNAHMAPLWGVLTRALGLPAFTAAYGFLFAHARATASAAVRAGALGSYAAQAVLGGAWLRGIVGELVEEHLRRRSGEKGHAGDGLADVGQTVPMLDLWVGRHEVLYTRIFNS